MELKVLLSLCLVACVAGDTTVTKTQFNPIDVFDVAQDGDAKNIRFAHRVNDAGQELLGYLTGDTAVVEMIESDVQWSTSNHSVLAHDDNPVSGGDISVYIDALLKLGITQVYSTQTKGCKLDFKRIEAVISVLEELSRKQVQLGRQNPPRAWDAPVWLNADVVPGPNAALNPTSGLDAKVFLQQIEGTFPQVTLSLGWVTSLPQGESEDDEYTWGMIMDMLKNVVPLTETHQPVTFPVRAKWLDKSWQQLFWLYSQLPENFTLTIWSNQGDEPSEESLVALKTLRQHMPRSSIFYDVGDSNFMPRFDSVLNDNNKPPLAKPEWPQMDWWRVMDLMNKEHDLLQDLEDARSTRSFTDLKLFIGEQGVMINNSKIVMQTKQQWQPKNITVTGRLEFIPADHEPPLEGGDMPEIPTLDSGAIGHIYLRTANLTAVQTTAIPDGLRMSIYRDGTIAIGETTNTATEEREKLDDDVEKGCFRFQVVDLGQDTDTEVSVYPCGAAATSSRKVVKYKKSYENQGQGFYLALGKGGRETDAAILFSDLQIHEQEYHGGSTKTSSTLALTIIFILITAIIKQIV